MKEGWEYKKLGEICRVINGRAYSKDEMLNQGKYRLLRVGNFFTNDSWYYSDLELEEDKYCDNGDLLYAWSASFGPRIWNGEKVIYHYHIWKMVCSEEIDKYFLCYWLDSDELKKQTMTNLHGATMAHITKRIIENAIVSYPSLSEQQSIVDYLDSAFAKIDAMKANAEKALNEAKALFQASLKEMLVPKEGWEVATIGKLGDIFGRIGFRGYTKNDLVAGPDEGAITLSPSNIQDGSMDYTSCTYISWFKYEESPEIMINNGDVLIVKTGSSYGKSAFVENLPHKATINPQSVVIKNIKIKNKFFAYLIRTPWVKAKFDEFVSGTAIPTFSQAKLSQVELSYPSNDVQNIICEKLDSLKSKVDRLQENYDKISQECDALKQAILRQVFE